LSIKKTLTKNITFRINNTNKKYLAVLFFTGLIAISGGCKEENKNTEQLPAKPNIIFMMADDMGENYRSFETIRNR